MKCKLCIVTYVGIKDDNELNLTAQLVRIIKMPNIDTDDSHLDECSILDKEFIFENVVLSDGAWQKRSMIYSTMQLEEYKMMLLNVLSFVYLRKYTTPVKQKETTRSIRTQKVHS